MATLLTKEQKNPDVLTHGRPLEDVIALASGAHHLRDKVEEHRPLHSSPLRQQHGHHELYAEVWLPLPHKQHLARFSVRTELLLDELGLIRDHRLHHLWGISGISMTVSTKPKTRQKGTVGHLLHTVQDSTGPQLQHPVPLPLQHLLLLYRQLLDLHAHCTECKLAQENGLPLHGNHQPVGPAVMSLQGIHHTHHQEVSGTLPQQLQGQSLKRQVHIQILKHGHKIIFTEVVIPSMCDVSLIKKGTTVQPHTTIAIELAFHFPEPGAHSPISQCLQLVLLPRIDAQFLSQSL